MHLVDAHNVRRFAKRLFNVAILEDAAPNTVCSRIVMTKDGVFQGFVGVDHNVQGLVLDLHELRGIVADVRRRGDDSSYRSPLVAHFGNRQRIIFDLREGIGPDLDEGIRLLRDFRAGERTNYTWKGFRCGSIETGHFRMSIRGAHELQIQHVVQLDVVDELAAAAEEPVVLLPRQLLADPTSAIGSRAHVTSLLESSETLLNEVRPASHRSTSAHSFFRGARAIHRPRKSSVRKSVLRPATQLWYHRLPERDRSLPSETRFRQRHFPGPYIERGSGDRL